jgi:hypothetical protein
MKPPSTGKMLEESFREETEEEFDDEDRREDDRELFIKRDGFEDISEDTAEEEVMKQAEVQKPGGYQEITKLRI